jgi:hypothetical protein
MRISLRPTDKAIGESLEDTARVLSRRSAVLGVLKVLIGSAAGISAGTLVGATKAFAVTCTCHYIHGNICGGTTTSACPSGCSICTSSDYCSGWCIYSGGCWTSCTGLGTCGNGSRICCDCKCPNCSSMCTSLSDCICCGCCTPEEVKYVGARELAALQRAS